MERRLSCSEIWGGGAAVDTAFVVPGMEGALFSQPADGPCGGDIYLVSSCNQGVVSKVVLADVSGHGEQVAQVGQVLSDLLRANVNERDNDRFLNQLNSQFEAEDDMGVIFATLACGTYFTRTGQFCFAYAGHPHMLLGRDGEFRPLSVQSASPSRIANLPIGVSPEVRFQEGRVTMRVGDWLVLFSDGLVEARNEIGQQYGLARLVGDLKRLAPTSPMVVKNGLLTRLREFVAPRPILQDDVTLIVLHLTEPPPRPKARMTPELERLLRGDPRS